MSTAPPTVQERLRAVAHVIDASFDPPGDEPGEPTLIFMQDLGGDELELGFKPVTDGTVYDAIIGMTAPEEWDAFGVSTTGTAKPSQRRVRTTALVARDGGQVNLVRYADGTSEVVEEKGVGLLDLCLARVLGASSPAPEVGVSALVAALWLRDCLATARSGKRLTWRGVAALHPAGDLLAAGPNPTVADLADGLRLFDRDLSWGLVRQRLIEGAWPAHLASPAQAEWMDEGLLSRWVMASHDPWSLAVALSDWVAPSTSRRLRSVLKSLTPR